MDFKLLLNKFLLKYKKNDTKERQPDSYLINDNSPFGMIESYNSLRTNIMFSLTHSDNGKIILLTSAVPSEGKTTISINTAIAFAKSGARVLLIDCDFRKSTIHRYLKLDGSVGITNVICGYTDIDTAIQRDVYEGVDIITVGEIPPNPTQILASPEMGKLLKELSTKYDYIFLDTPPASLVTDAVLVAGYCDGVAVVVREDYTHTDRLDMAINNLKKANANMLGFIVLTNKKQRKRYGYGRYGKYGNYGKYGDYGYYGY